MTPIICQHPVTRFSSLESSVRGAKKLWHRCAVCGLPVLVKVYLPGQSPVGLEAGDISVHHRRSEQVSAS